MNYVYIFQTFVYLAAMTNAKNNMKNEAKTLNNSNNHQVTAINKQHQSLVNRAVKAMARYEELNTKRDNISNNLCCLDDERLLRKLDRQCENQYDKYLDLISLLPKREVTNLETAINFN